MPMCVTTNIHVNIILTDESIQNVLHLQDKIAKIDDVTFSLSEHFKFDEIGYLLYLHKYEIENMNFYKYTMHRALLLVRCLS